jgi:hypothetical protein
MGQRCGSREWKKEEMMAYLDWSKQEDDRIEALVEDQIVVEGPFTTRRGMASIWKDAEKDVEEQEALYSK